MSIEVVDAVNLARLAPFDGPAGLARRYLASMITGGPARYIDNAKIHMEALVIEEKILPLVISDESEGNSNVCSAYAHYLEYAFQELARRYPRVPGSLLKPPRFLLGALLRGASIDRVVFVNNWLLTTNPRHGLSAAQIAALSIYLTRRYPGSAIVFRSINPLGDRTGLDALQANNYLLIPSRRVYMLDARDARFLQRSNARNDLKQLRDTPFSIIDDPEILVQHAQRLTTLYRDLYLGKYTPLNPQFNEDFITLTLGERFLTYRALLEDGRVSAFSSYFIEGEVMTAALLGYDLNRPQSLGLYRLAFALVIAEAARRKALLNMGAGSGTFKMFRGAVPIQEYDAVYVRHLPLHRRLAWDAVRTVMRLGALRT